MKLDSRGFNLVSVIVALAVFSMLMATVSLLYKNVVEMGMQAEISHDIDSMMHTVQDVLSSDKLCHRALRAVTGATPPSPAAFQLVNWNLGALGSGSFGTVMSIQANDGSGTPAAVIVISGAPLNNSSKVQITSIRIREPNPTAARLEGQPARSALVQGGARFWVVAAKVEFSFDWAPGYANLARSLPSGTLRRRTADVSVAVNIATNRVQFCYGGAVAQSISMVCGGPAPAPAPRTACGPMPAPSCVPHYFLAGFDANALPICDCRITCAAGAVPHPPQGGGGKGASVFSGALAAGAGPGGSGFGAAPGGAAAVGLPGGGPAGAALGPAAGPGVAGPAGVVGPGGPYGAGPSSVGSVIYTN